MCYGFEGCYFIFLAAKVDSVGTVRCYAVRAFALVVQWAGQEVV